MAKTDITARHLRELLRYNPHTGIFTWRVSTSNRVHVGDIAGTKSKTDGYIYIGVRGQRYPAHRLAWFYVHGVWPLRFIDHKNGTRDNNRLRNLRPVTDAENGQNRRGARKDSKSGILGVCWCAHRKRWIAQLVLDGKNVHYSCHTALTAACAARLAAESKYYPFSTSHD